MKIGICEQYSVFTFLTGFQNNTWKPNTPCYFYV
ncbi:unknown [Prevotella sp. CAG:485]|nr:unknown [Prevotella sp. CAG:485]